MKVMDFTRTPPRLAVHVEESLPHEMLMSLTRFASTAERSTFEDPDWYDRVRAKASLDLLDAIERLGGAAKSWGGLLRLIRGELAATTVPEFIARVEDTEPVELRLNLLGYYAPWYAPTFDRERIRAAAEGDQTAGRALRADPDYADEGEEEHWTGALDSLDPPTTRSLIVDILRGWHRQVFAQDEASLADVLAHDAAAKRALAEVVSPEALIESATNGLEYRAQPWTRRVLLIPHVTMRPWNVMNAYDDVYVIGYPVADESLGVDGTAPPARLVRLHKALGDEKRLRMLRMLARSSATLQELADGAGIAKSTAHHHLVILRSAGLIRVTLEEQSRYTLRREFVPEAAGWLPAFLEGRPR